MLENQFNQSEKRLNEQIIQLKGTIKSKDETIAQITKQNIELKQLISKNEIEWHLKENEYENLLKVKDRKIQELEDSNGIDNLPNLIKTLKEQNASLRKTINALRKELDSVRLLFTPEILHVYRNLSEKDLKSLIKIKEQQTIIKNLEAKVAYIKRLADEYLCKLIKLQSNHDS